MIKNSYLFYHDPVPDLWTADQVNNKCIKWKSLYVK